jgi:hypothetical protein
MLQLVQSSAARPWSLALSWGSQSWLQPAFSRLSRRLASFSGFAARLLKDTSPKKLLRLELLAGPGSKSRLKGGCRQDCLPHFASQPRAMNGQSRESNAEGGLKGRLQARLPATRKKGVKNAS